MTFLDVAAFLGMHRKIHHAQEYRPPTLVCCSEDRVEIFNVNRVWSWLLVALSLADDVEFGLKLSDGRTILLQQLPSILQYAAYLVVSILDRLVGEPQRMDGGMVAKQISICYPLNRFDMLQSFAGPLPATP